MIFALANRVPKQQKNFWHDICSQKFFGFFA
jgi:hypothetical protein